MNRMTNVRDVQVTSTSGKNVKDTSQLKGEAKDSLSGSNSTVQKTTGTDFSGPYGGMNKNK